MGVTTPAVVQEQDEVVLLELVVDPGRADAGRRVEVRRDEGRFGVRETDREARGRGLDADLLTPASPSQRTRPSSIG